MNQALKQPHPPSPYEDAQPSAHSALRQPLYRVHIRKFWILYLATLGMYGLYWNYKHWALIKQARSGNQWPVARAIFSIFFTHALYREINDLLPSGDSRSRWNHQSLATLTVVLMIASGIAGRLAGRGIGSPLSDFLTFAAIPAIAYLRAQAQRMANLACGDPDGLSNYSWSGLNVLWIAIGSIFWLLWLVSLFLTA